jgi:hypothetical protein
VLEKNDRTGVFRVSNVVCFQTDQRVAPLRLGYAPLAKFYAMEGGKEAYAEYGELVCKVGLYKSNPE